MYRLMTVFITLLMLEICLAQPSKKETEKTTLAVLDLDYAGISENEAKLLTDRLRYELFRTDRYIVLERSRMEDILKEQRFQLSGCTSDECLIEIGKMVGVQAMVGGSIGKFGNLYTVNIRMIDTETGSVISNAVVDYKGSPDGLLTEGIKKVALRLSGLEKDESEKIITRKETIQQSEVSKSKHGKNLYRWNLNFAMGRATLSYKFPFFRDEIDFSEPVIHQSIGYFFNSRFMFALGLTWGNKMWGDGHYIGDDVYITEINHIQLYAGMYYYLWRYVSIGAGVQRLTAEAKFVLSSRNERKGESSLFWGLGVHFPIWKRVELFFNAMTTGGDTRRMNQSILGLRYRFGARSYR